MRKFTGLIVLIVLILTAVVVTGITFSNRSFNEGIYRSGGVFRHIDILTSEKYNGKLTGSEGNWAALDYIENFFKELGIKPAGEDGTYYQKFKTLVPDIGTEPVFTVKDDSGEVLIDLTMYKDYKAVTSFNGGGIDFEGELIFIESSLLRIDPALIKDRIVVITVLNITPEHINYVRDNGGIGILNNADESMYAYSRYHELEKDVSNWTKTGETIFAAYISHKIYKEMLKHADEYVSDDRIKPLAILNNTEIKVDVGFPIKETANILGKIEGKANNGRYLIISANIDGAGEGTDGRYFPGAISNTNGLALMMETARVIANQDNLPFETIIFAGWNGQKQQFSGSEYYLEHWLYPPDKTTLIHLDDIGYETVEGLKISSESIVSGILKDKISNIAEDLGIRTEKIFPYYGPATRFADYGAEGVLLGDVFYMKDHYYDNSASTDNKSILNAALVLLNFIKRETFRDTFPDYLRTYDFIIAGIILLIFLINLVIGRLYKKSPGMKLGKMTIEEVYYSTPVSLLRKGILAVTPVVIAVVLLVFLANIDPEATADYAAGKIDTNFSWYLTIKRTLMYFKGTGISAGRGVAGTMAKAALRSLALMFSALVLSVATGVFSGMYGAYMKSRKNLRSFGSLVIFSIPDVLIVLIGILLYVMIAKAVGFDNNVTILKKFIFPLITLSILPSIYITRMTYIAVQEELSLGYVMNARAKGFKRKRVFISEILPAVSFKTIDSLPAIMTMLISNMIIVEYMFNYLGILHYLIYFYNRQNVSGFTAMALILGAIYILMTWGVQRIARRVNPLKGRLTG